MKNKKAAMEMSVGTIVTIVLLVSVLVLGSVLIRNIFTTAKDVVDLTDNQLKDEVNKLFSGETRLVIYPKTTKIEMERGEQSGIGIGIRNVLRGPVKDNKFSYEVIVDDPDVRENCGITATEIERWIRGRKGIDIPMPVKEGVQVERVLFDIPETAPLCSVKMRVNVKIDDGTVYDSASFFLVTVGG